MRFFNFSRVVHFSLFSMYELVSMHTMDDTTHATLCRFGAMPQLLIDELAEHLTKNKLMVHVVHGGYRFTSRMGVPDTTVTLMHLKAELENCIARGYKWT